MEYIAEPAPETASRGRPGWATLAPMAPAIILHYAVQAAADEDAGRPSRH